MEKSGYRLLVLAILASVLPALGKETDIARLKRLADANDPVSQYNLAVHYEEGTSVSKAPEKAFYWYRRAADQGHKQAQYNLGVCFAQGIGTDANDAEAVHWFLKPSIQSDFRS